MGSFFTSRTTCSGSAGQSGNFATNTKTKKLTVSKWVLLRSLFDHHTLCVGKLLSIVQLQRIRKSFKLKQMWICMYEGRRSNLGGEVSGAVHVFVSVILQSSFFHLPEVEYCKYCCFGTWDVNILSPNCVNAAILCLCVFYRLPLHLCQGLGQRLLVSPFERNVKRAQCFNAHLHPHRKTTTLTRPARGSFERPDCLQPSICNT